MNLGFIFITNQINCYIFYTAAVNGLGIKLSKDKVKPEGSQLSPCYQYQAIFIKDRFLVNGDILPAPVLSNKENKSTSLSVRLFCSLFDFKKMALPQIEWVNISIEPANTPLSVIPAEAGIQCLLAPGRWITEYIHVFCPSGQPSAVKSAPDRFHPAKNVQE